MVGDCRWGGWGETRSSSWVVSRDSLFGEKGSGSLAKMQGGTARSVFGTRAELGDGEDAGGAKLGDDEGGRQKLWVEERGGVSSALSLSLSLSLCEL